MSVAEDKQLALPEHKEDLTPEWFTWALQQRFPGTEVLTARVGEVLAATATKIRVHLTYNEAGQRHGLPPSVMVKGAFSRNAEAMEHTFTHEMLAYRDLVSDIGLKTPKCYFAAKEGINPVWIIEDLALTDTVYGKPQHPLTFNQARSILDLLARLHAQYWEKPEVHDDEGPLHWVLRTVTGWHLDYMLNVTEPEQWAFYAGLPRGAAVQRGLVRDVGRIRRAMLAQFEHHKRGPLTLGHGDAHIANVYFNGDDAGLLDWEMRRCPWYHDVTYFLISSLDIADRRRWQGALLQHYLEALERLGVTMPGFNAAWDEYRREIIYGYVLFMTNGDGTQYWNEPDNAAVVNRYAAAMEDLGTLELIERDIAG